MKRKWHLTEKLIAVASVSLIVLILLCVCAYCTLNYRISTLASQTYVGTADASDIIAFLKDQIQMIVWFFGLIITIFGAGLAFFEFKTKASVEKQFQEKYSKLLGGKNAEVFNKKICFVYRERDNNFDNFCDELRDRSFNVEIYKTNLLNDRLSALRDASIVVLKVVDESDLPMCELISNMCEINNIHCAIYCPGYIAKLSDITGRSFRTSLSNQIPKLRESIYTLLYLAP
ncbi:MAG: hypothetical protein LBU77_02815 [Clostridiales bacterium]|jgi:hypothetical protein|nr:hypothetical protein [Clostridiales bacterium]